MANKRGGKVKEMVTQIEEINDSLGQAPDKTAEPLTPSVVASQTVQDLHYYEARLKEMNRLKDSVASEEFSPVAIRFASEKGKTFEVEIGTHGMALLRVTSQHVVRDSLIGLLEWESLEAALHAERLLAKLEGMLRK